MNNEEEAKKRCAYASKLLKNSNILHEIKNENIGHINIIYQNKVVMSFWSRTGKFIYVNSSLFNKKLKPINDARGIKACIEYYKKNFE